MDHGVNDRSNAIGGITNRLFCVASVVSYKYETGLLLIIT